MSKIRVQDAEITVISIDDKDYISLTDMVKNIENGLALIEKWLRNKNTIEFLGIWEEMYNPDFNSPEFEGIRKQAGLNSFVLTPKQWVEKTNAVGIFSKSGRYGGTFEEKLSKTIKVARMKPKKKSKHDFQDCRMDRIKKNAGHDFGIKGLTRL